MEEKISREEKVNIVFFFSISLIVALIMVYCKFF